MEKPSVALVLLFYSLNVFHQEVSEQSLHMILKLFGIRPNRKDVTV